MSYFLHRNGQNYGPYDLQQLQDMLVAGQISTADHVLQKGGAEWSTVGAILSTMAQPTVAPPTTPSGNHPQLANTGLSTNSQGTKGKRLNHVAIAAIVMLLVGGIAFYFFYSSGGTKRDAANSLETATPKPPPTKPEMVGKTKPKPPPVEPVPTPTKPLSAALAAAWQKAGLSREQVATWQKAGFQAGWMGPKIGGFIEFSFYQEELLPSKAIPTFQMLEWKPGVLNSLPAPTSAFGLTLSVFNDIADAGLKEVAQLQQLTSLDLRFCELITDEGLKELTQLHQLTSLALGDLLKCKITDAGLKEVVKIQQLTLLNLPSQITDAGLKEMVKLRQLNSIHVGGYSSKITDAGLKEVAQLQKLTSLSLFGCKQITDEGLKEVTQLQKLTYLNLNQCGPITDAGLKDVAQLQMLTSLGLGWCKQITDAGLREVAKLQQLTILELSGTRITEAGLKEVAKLQLLTKLGLFDCKQITDAGLKELSGLKLKSLSTPDQVRTDLGLKHYLAAISPPSYLNLSRWKITDVGLKEVAKLQQLTSLNLPGQITDAGLKEVAKLQQLRELDLPSQITNAGLKEMAKLQQLRELDLRGCNQITDEAVAELKKALPNCEIDH